jgi:DNA modification methylase
VTPNTILHGDCLHLLPHITSDSIDFILTDPPYLVRYKSRDGRAVPNDDNDAWLKPAFAEMYRVLKPDCFAVSFYGWPSADRFLAAYREAGFRPVGHLIFPKGYSSSTGYVSSEHENAHLLVKGSPWRCDAVPLADYNSTNREFLEHHLGNVKHAIDRMCNSNDVNGDEIQMQCERQVKHSNLFLHHQGAAS